MPAQSPDLIINEPLWGVFGGASHLTSVLQEERLRIPLAAVQDLYPSFPRTTDAGRPYTILINYCDLKPVFQFHFPAPVAIYMFMCKSTSDV